MKHVHAELIKAWAEGATIQFARSNGNWDDIKDPSWVPKTQYRVKPEPAIIFYEQGTPEHIALLMADDPSKGSATHFSKCSLHGNKYHMYFNGIWYFWSDLPPGGWKAYTAIDQIAASRDLVDAIVLKLPKVKYIPTKQDYANGIRSSSANYVKRRNKLNAQIHNLEVEIQLIKHKYTEKLYRARRLMAGS